MRAWSTMALFSLLLLPGCSGEEGAPHSPTAPSPAAAVIGAAESAPPYLSLYFLAPLGDGSQPPGALDATLIHHLAVEICTRSGTTCGTRLGWITAQSRGAERLRIEDDDVPHYHATWNIPGKPSRGDVYHVRVWLAGTELGSAEVEAAGLRGALPIKFVVPIGAAGVVGEAGGTVVAGGGAIVLSIPAGAVSKPTGFTALPVTTPPEDDVVATLPGTAVELLPEDVAFDPPVRVTVAYDGDVLGALSEANLRMFKLVAGAWVPVPGSTVDTEANTVHADLPSFSIYVLGAGTPVLDGAIGATEWSAALTIPFTANLPSGGTAAGTAYVMNDASDIYVGVHVATSVADVALTVGFDPDRNGLESGDDAVDLYTSGGRLYFRDLFTKPSCTGSCEAFDVDYPGRVDGTAAVVSTATSTTIEVAHPFTGGDAPYDIFMNPGQTLCMVIDLSLDGTVTLVAGSTSYPAPGGGCAFEVEIQGPAAAKPATGVTLAPATELHEVGTPITLTATVTAGGGTLTGTERVDFATGEIVLGTATVSAVGTATLTTSSLELVAHPLTARLHPTATLQGSTSPTVRQDMIQRFTNLAGFAGSGGILVPGTSQLQDFESGVSLPTILANVFTVAATLPLEVVAQCGGTTSKMLTGTESPDSPVRDGGLARYQFLPDAINGRNAVAFEIHDQAAGSTPVVVEVLLVKPYSFSVAAAGSPSFFGVVTTADLPLEGIHVAEGLVSSGGSQVSDAICFDDFRAEKRAF